MLFKKNPTLITIMKVTKKSSNMGAVVKSPKVNKQNKKSTLTGKPLPKDVTGKIVVNKPVSSPGMKPLPIKVLPPTKRGVNKRSVPVDDSDDEEEVFDEDASDDDIAEVSDDAAVDEEEQGSDAEGEQNSDAEEQDSDIEEVQDSDADEEQESDDEEASLPVSKKEKKVNKKQVR